jgi:hypothetical protein
MRYAAALGGSWERGEQARRGEEIMMQGEERR